MTDLDILDLITAGQAELQRRTDVATEKARREEEQRKREIEESWAAPLDAMRAELERLGLSNPTLRHPARQYDAWWHSARLDLPGCAPIYMFYSDAFREFAYAVFKPYIWEGTGLSCGVKTEPTGSFYDLNGRNWSQLEPSFAVAAAVAHAYWQTVPELEAEVARRKRLADTLAAENAYYEKLAAPPASATEMVAQEEPAQVDADPAGFIAEWQELLGGILEEFQGDLLDGREELRLQLEEMETYNTLIRYVQAVADGRSAEDEIMYPRYAEAA